jgi:MarR family transcriptional regulator for hemolysin
MADSLVFKPVRRPREWFTVEVADGLANLSNDRAIRRSMKTHRLDMRADHAPLARPVRADGLATMDVATIHTIGPGDVIGERRQHAVYVPRVEAIVQALEELDIIIHWLSSWHGARVVAVAVYIYICTYTLLWRRLMQGASVMDLNVLSTPGHLISLAARGFARLSEARLKPLGFGVGHLPVLVALQDGQASTQRDLARFARIEQPPMAQMLARMERDGLIRRAPDPDDGRSSRITLTEIARARLPDAVAALLRGNREVLRDFTDDEARLLIALLTRLIANLDQVASAEMTLSVRIPEKGRPPGRPRQAD